MNPAFDSKPLSRRSFHSQVAAASIATSAILEATYSSNVAAQEKPTKNSAAQAAISAAKTFLQLLSSEQRAQAVLPFADARRIDWHFIPLEQRKGLPLRDMTEPQRQAALALLKQVVSPSGYQRSLDVFAYEAILLELEGPAAAKRRDYTKYYYTLYGEPSETTAWGLSIEGHHLSLNYTFEAGAIVDSTPQFFGVNPATLKKSFSTPDISNASGKLSFDGGKRLLEPEEDSAFALLGSLSKAQLEKAIFDAECPDDIQWAGEPQPKNNPPAGIKVSELDPPQKTKLRAILAAFNANMPDEIVRQRNALIEKAGIDTISFGWAGATSKSGQHYFRVQGPTFIAELCNFQTDPEKNVANHIHAVWRDMTGDFHQSIST
jgi:hypothetical protein